MEKDYYSPDFDPNSLTKQKLKSLLSSEGVELPGTDQKKDVYVGLFLKNISGKIKTSVIPSTKGIIQVSKTGTPLKGHEDSPWSSPSTLKKSPRGRSTSVVRTPNAKMKMDDETIREKPTSPSKRLSPSKRTSPAKRVSPSKSPRGSKKRTETVSPSSSRAKTSPVTSPVSKRLSSPRGRRTFKSDLSEDSSDLMPEILSLIDSSTHDTKRSRSKHFVLTDDPNEPIKIAQTSSGTPVLQRLKTMEELQTTYPIHKARARASTKVYSPNRGVSASLSHPKRKPLRKFIWLAIVFLGGLVIVNLLCNLWNKPFCDSVPSERPVTSKCRPCPEHGLCKYGKLSCANGYVYSYGYCVPDKRRLKVAYKMIAHIKNHLHRRAGDHLCGYIETPDESKSELEAFLRSLKSVNTSDFSDAFEAALREIGMNPAKFDLKLIETNETQILRSIHPKVPLTCSLRLKISRVVWKFRFQLFYMSIGLLSILYVTNLFHERKVQARIVNLLADEVQGVLSAQKERSLREPSVVPYISVNHLRDSLILNLRRRSKQKIWDSVRKMIRMNSCIKESMQMIGGEEHRVWEWNAPPILSPFKEKKRPDTSSNPSDVHSSRQDQLDQVRAAFPRSHQGPLYPSISSPSTTTRN